MSLDEKERFVIPLASPVRSLCWDGDELVDWVLGGVRYSLSGVETRANVHFPYRFDRAISSPDGQFSILYEVLGTKALITSEQRHVRELNRSYYRANAYEYPITVFRLPDGTMALAHCPDEYNKIEIEELASGRRLTARTCEPQDVFHSRLQISPGGTYLLSAGWVWGSADVIQVFNVGEVLKNPEHLDAWRNIFHDEVYSAAFQTDDVLLLNAENENTDCKGRLVGFSLAESRLMFSTLLDFFPGTIMPVGKDHVVGFYDHPKLFENASGKVIREWPDLKSGKQGSSIVDHLNPIPPMALDAAHQRFAIADEKQITVIQIG